MNFQYLKRLWPRKPAFSKLDFALGTKASQIEQVGVLPPGGSVAFVVSRMTKGSGGHTSVLRLGTWMSKFGYEVSYIALPGQSKSQFGKLANFNLPRWQGTPVEWSEFASGDKSYDLGTATLWASCYYLAKHWDRFDRKGYFVQDYEPYFYPVGDEYCLAENSYRMGLDHRSLGPWNLDRIADHTRIRNGVALAFPVELSEYPLTTRALTHRKQLRLAVYLRTEARRGGTLISLGLEHAISQLGSRGIEVQVRAFGMADASRRLRVGENLGKLNRDQLRELYAWADFGIVGSLTNISLVNYEMIACGLPVIDFEMGSAPSFFAPSEMLFMGAAPESLFAIFDEWIGRTRDLEAMVAAAQHQIRSNDWTWERVATDFRQSFS